MREVESCEVSEGRVQEETNSSVSGLRMTEVEALQQHTACGGRREGGRGGGREIGREIGRGGRCEGDRMGILWAREVGRKCAERERKKVNARER